MKWFYKLLAFILALFLYSPSESITSYSTSKENAEMVFTVLSDVHMEGNNEEKFELFGEAIRDINAAEENHELIFLGDNTMNNQVIELSAFYGILSEWYSGFCHVVSGNHDLCPSDYNIGDYDDLKKRFLDYFQEFESPSVDDLYYSFFHGTGYGFIILGSESDAGVQEDISDEQFQWLENELKLHEDDGKPIFILNHYPLNHTWEDVWTEGHIGEDSERLHEIMKNSKNRIIYFSGHLHMGIYDNQVSYINEDNITYISVPAFGAINNVGDADIQNNGMGLYVEVYENEIIIRVRNFAEHKWMDIEHIINI